MDHYLRAYGLPKNEDTLLIDPTSRRCYGLAYMITGKTDWICIDGTFDHLYGTAMGLMTYNDLTEDDRELRIAFYVLDDEGNPIELINKFKYTTRDRLVTEFTSIPDESFEPVNFEL